MSVLGRPRPSESLLVSETLVKRMKSGAVIVDVAVDQGGCVETIRPTTLLEAVHTLHGVLHYGVTKMPALVPRTSTSALTNVTLRYALDLARKGPMRAVRESPELARGVNLWRGCVAYPAVAAVAGEKPLPLDVSTGPPTADGQCQPCGAWKGSLSPNGKDPDSRPIPTPIPGT